MTAKPRRQRVSLGHAFKLAGSASLKADDPTGGEGSIIATILFGFWWWIRGAPVSDDSGSPSGEPPESR